MRIVIYSHSIAPSIDGVCRRFTAILKELDRLGHELLIFTLESDPKDLPSNARVVSIDYMTLLPYPEKKVAKPSLQSLFRIWVNIVDFKPDIVHITGDAYSQSFALVCNFYRFPIVASFHTDLLDLFNSLGAFEFQKWCVLLLEYVDSFILDSCATTSVSFAVSFILLTKIILTMSLCSKS